jgi:hypothetical protein
MAQSLAGGVCQLRMMPEAHRGRFLGPHFEGAEYQARIASSKEVEAMPQLKVVLL